MLAFGSSPLTSSMNCDFSWKLFCRAMFSFRYQLSQCMRISLRTLSLSIQGSSDSCQSFSCQSLGSICFAFLLDLRQVSDSDFRARGSLSKLFLLFDENCLRLRLEVFRLDFLPSSLGESLPTSLGMRQSLAILGTSRQSYSRKLLLSSPAIAKGQTISQTNLLVSTAINFGSFLLVQMPSTHSSILPITSMTILPTSVLLLQLFMQLQQIQCNTCTSVPLLPLINYHSFATYLKNSLRASPCSQISLSQQKVFRTTVRMSSASIANFRKSKREHNSWSRAQWQQGIIGTAFQGCKRWQYGELSTNTTS